MWQYVLSAATVIVEWLATAKVADAIDFLGILGAAIAFLITGGGSALAFVRGLHEYRRAQAWKRAEFVKAELDAWEKLPAVVAAELMLDWNVRSISAPDPQGGTEPIRWKHSDTALPAALRAWKAGDGDFTWEQVAIRDAFDEFFAMLERFEALIDAQLLEYKDVDPYLGYWLAILGSPVLGQKDEVVRAAVLTYLRVYRFRGARKLILRWAQANGHPEDKVDPSAKSSSPEEPRRIPEERLPHVEQAATLPREPIVNTAESRQVAPEVGSDRADDGTTL